MQPHTGTGLSLKVSTAPRGVAAPVVGAVDTMRVEVRDEGGAELAALVIPIAAGQRTFQAALDVPAGTGRIVTVMGLGLRPVGAGDPPPSDRGVLFLDRVDGVDIAAGESVPLAITLRLFVPDFLDAELLDGTRHRLRWNRVPGAVRYELLRESEDGPILTSLTDTTFTDDGLPAGYQLRAFELGGRRSAVSDPLLVALPNPPTVPTGLTATGISPTRIDVAWQPVTGAGAVTYDLERRVLPSATFAVLATGLTASNFSDDGVDADHTYGYRVRAVGRGGASDFSTEVLGNAVPALPGAPTGLTAEALSATLVRLAWTKGPGRVDAYDVERRVPPAPFAVLTTLTGDRLGYDDTATQERTGYEYRVIPRNVSGAGPASNVAAVTTPAVLPNAPGALVATVVSPSAIDLSWVDNSADETGFELQRAVGAGGAFVFLVQMLPDVRAFSDIKLTEKTLYRYRVRALKNDVASEWSAEASATTPTEPPAAPGSLSARALSATTVRLDWVDNAANEDSLRVERKNAGGGWDRVAGLPANSVSTDVTGLLSLTTYTFRVVAINAGGESPSVEASVTTPGTAPNGPTQLSGRATAWNRVVLDWVDTADDETSFDILRQQNLESVFFSVGANTTTFTDTTVVGATTYSYRVRSRNNVDVSGYAGPASVTTPPGPPGVPPNFAAVAVSGTVITLSWSASSGNPTTYLLEMRLPPAAFAPLATVTSTIFLRDVTGLVPNTTYEFRIRARSNNGDSNWSPVASARTAQTVPAAPSGLAGSGLAGGTSVQLNWTDNATNETGFRIEARLNQGGVFALVGTPDANSTGAVIGGLTPSTSYDFRVAATNELGASGFSNVALVTTVATPPPTPVNVAAVGESSSRIALSWQAGTGGGVATDYSIERRQPPAGSFVAIASVSAAQFDYGDNGLPSDTPFDYRMRAHNAAGFSAYSDTVSARTLLDAPGPPQGFAAAPVAGTSTQIQLTWDASSTGGPPAFYDLLYRVQGANSYTPLVTVTAPGQSHTATGLAPSTTYQFELKARNATASSAFVFATATTYLPAPAAPTNFVGYMYNNDGQEQLMLEWTDNANNEDAYDLQRAPDGPTLNWVALPVLQPGTTSYIDYDAENTGVQHYRLSARNLGGSSAWVQITINTDPAFLPVPDNFVPNPQSATQIRLEWGDVASNETAYEIQSGTPSTPEYIWSPLVTLPANSTSNLRSGLSPSAIYYFRMRTVGSLGQVSSWVGGFSATTAATAPNAPTGLFYYYDTQANALTIYWSDNSTNETRFDISRQSLSGGPRTVIASAGINMNAITLSGTGISPAYLYYVTAVNGVGGSISVGRAVP